MMAAEKVEVGRPERPTFGDVRREPDSVVASSVVAAELNYLTARREVVSHYRTGFADLADFFTRLAENWRSWSGTKAYESLEGNLLLEAIQTGSHVELHFTLQDAEFQGSWSVRGKLALDPGEDLTRVSEDIHELLGPPRRSNL